MVGVPGEDGAVVVYLDTTEVTTAAYADCVKAGACSEATRVYLSEGGVRALGGMDTTATPEELSRAWGSRCNAVRGAEDHPANCVNHDSALRYCAFVDKRLPTAAEWQLAARGKGRSFPWGEAEPSCDTACFGLNGACFAAGHAIATCPVSSHEGDRTPEGIRGLAGNVAEWVAGSAGDNPAARQVMGGSFFDEAALLRGDQSRVLPPLTSHVSMGFRCAVSPPPAEDG